MTTATIHPHTEPGRKAAAVTTAPGAAPQSAGDGPAVACGFAAARAAQPAWAAAPIADRLRVLRNLRHALAADAEQLAQSIDSPARTLAERLSSEVLPLADAIRFLERDAPRLLQPKRFGRSGRPLWVGRSTLEVRREPLGVVLVVGPSNYPLLLAGVQAVQALAAGNAVLLKPAPGHSPPLQRLRRLAVAAGLDERLMHVLDERAEVVAEAARAGVDKVFLTGSAETGQAVSALLAPHLIPATMELSGHDAVFVCDDADLDLTARCVAFGLTLNGGRTCIAPRRVFVPAAQAADLEAKLAAALGRTTPQAAPESGVSIVPVRDMNHALALAAESPYRLGATVFGSRAAAEALARRVDAGCVVVNDMIVPTADPRLPFGGRGRSGYGVTRGGDGLLEMTRPKAIVVRRGSFRPHLDPPHPLDGDLFRHYLAAAHGGSLGQRLRGAANVVLTLIQRGRPS